jgi:hypothetical protein
MSNTLIWWGIGPEARIAVDIDRSVPARQSTFGDVQPQLAPSVIWPKVMDQLDILEAFDAVVEDSCNANGSSDGAKYLYHVGQCCTLESDTATSERKSMKVASKGTGRRPACTSYVRPTN